MAQLFNQLCKGIFSRGILKSQGFWRQWGRVRCWLESILVPLQSRSLFPRVLEHLPLAEGIKMGVIPEEALPVMKEGKAATSNLKTSLHPSGNMLSDISGPENAACSWEGGLGQSF